mmetsp:Transcript_4408/g.19998  ORF Transcript_4408/g.19998 Transcript_4408/m.19998 type:complete len:215 (+) Transcript_4408:1414-2058(+)
MGSRAVRSGRYSSASAVTPAPPPALPPTATLRPNGRLLTTAATLTSFSSHLSQSAAFVTQFVDGDVASASWIRGGGARSPEVSPGLERFELERGGRFASFAQSIEAVESRPASSMPRRVACAAGMAGTKLAMFPCALRTICALTSPPMEWYPRLQAACKIVPPPQHGSTMTFVSGGPSVSSFPSSSPPIVREKPPPARTALSAAAAISGRVPAL